MPFFLRNIHKKFISLTSHQTIPFEVKITCSCLCIILITVWLMVLHAFWINEDVNLDGKNAPTYALDRWNKGYKGLSESEKKIWESANASKIAGKSEDWIERLWKNQQYYKLFGDEVFYSTPAEELDRRYYNYLASKAIVDKYGSNKNIQELLSLTPEAKDELVHSDYKSDAYYKDEAEDRIFDGKHSWKDRLYSGLKTSWSRMWEGTWLGAAAGSIIPGVGTATGAITGTAGMALEGFLEGVVHPEKDGYLSYEKEKNDEIFNKILANDNQRIKQEAQPEINKISTQLYTAYTQGQLSESDINKMFDDIALNNDKKVYVDELGNERTH